MDWVQVDSLTPKVLLKVRVIPRSKHEGLSTDQQYLRVRLRAPPTDGKANKALKKILAERFGVAKSAVRLLNGERNRDKTVAILGPLSWPEELPPPPDGLSCDV